MAVKKAKEKKNPPSGRTTDYQRRLERELLKWAKNAKKEIDVKFIQRVAGSMMSLEHMAQCLGMTIEGMITNYGSIIDEYKGIRRLTLSEAMWDKALNGRDLTAMIWLSKQHLGYCEPRHERETPQVTYNVTVNAIPVAPKDRQDVEDAIIDAPIESFKALKTMDME